MRKKCSAAKIREAKGGGMYKQYGRKAERQRKDKRNII